ncbi:unnamed protein product [Clonostachys rhizophaga]|uniref:Major facilitator superfamily (MFS) profile domain-containing protein n=1 Tax=Clonostachys rhizophaga TaxID=160324 RepID=A0A9N9VVD9_9HYPO|nr:unnamed protein product [Clonostachys rhizophaga]
MTSSNSPLPEEATMSNMPPGPELRSQSPGHFRLVLGHMDISHNVLRHPYRGEGTAESPFLIEFLPEDPYNPMEFPSWIKWSITFVLAVASLAVAFASTAYSTGIEDIMEQLDVSSEVAIIGLSLFVLGLAVGPVFCAPLSEEYGRQYLFITTMAAHHVTFNAGAAASRNIETLIILRFFAVVFGAAPYTNSNAVLAGIFPASQRGVAMTFFGAAPFLGPALGPIAGGFLGAAGGWRWIQGLMAIFTAVF